MAKMVRKLVESMKMTVDIHQLPIPEWHLRCPNCDYLLNGLPSHRCSECGDPLDMATLIPTYARLREPRFTGEELPFPDFGLYCNRCDEPLAGARKHECPSCQEPFEPSMSRPKKPRFVANKQITNEIAPQLLALLLEHDFIPYTLEEKHNPVSGLMTWSLHVLSEFHFDFLWLVRNKFLASNDATEQPEWQCQDCGNDNPANFDACWSCGEARE